MLNFNAVAVQAGAPLRLFTPMLLLFCMVSIFAMRTDLRILTDGPVVSVLFFFAVFLPVGLLSAMASRLVPLDTAVTKVPDYFATILLIIVGSMVAYRAFRAGQFDQLLKLLFFLTACASISGVAFLLIPSIANALSVVATSRLSGVFGNVNELGLQSGYSIVLGLVLTMRTKNPVWLIAGLAAGVTGVVASFSKTAMLSLLTLVALLVYAWSGAQLKLKPILFLLAGLVFAAAGGKMLASRIIEGSTNLQLATDQYKRLTQIVEILETGSIDESTSTGRTMLWRAGLDQWSGRPVTGTGLTSFGRLRAFDLGVHNTFLLVLGESGIVGFLPFLLAISVIVYGVIRCPRSDLRVLGLGILLVIFPLLMSSHDFLVMRNHNLMIGILVGILVAARKAGRGGVAVHRDSLPVMRTDAAGAT